MGQHHIADPAWRKKNRARWLATRKLKPEPRLVKEMPISPKRLFRMLVAQCGSVAGAKKQLADEATKTREGESRDEDLSSDGSPRVADSGSLRPRLRR